MRCTFLFSLIFILLLSCKKEHNGPEVDIYMLQSFSLNINQATNPATISISNAVLAETPLVADHDIRSYTRSTTTFNLRKDIKSTIQNYGPDKAFAVTVDKQVVYYGKFHPAYLSSITFGLATIDPIFYSNNELKIHFAAIDGNSNLQQLDKRNDTLIINALSATGRLR